MRKPQKKTQIKNAQMAQKTKGENMLEFRKPTKREVTTDQTLFTMFDSKIGKYELPMMAANKLDIIRQLENLFKSPDAQKSKYFTNAEDFSLFAIGTFDKSTGKITAQELEHVANMHDIKAYCLQ